MHNTKTKYNNITIKNTYTRKTSFTETLTHKKNSHTDTNTLTESLIYLLCQELQQYAVKGSSGEWNKALANGEEQIGIHNSYFIQKENVLFEIRDFVGKLNLSFDKLVNRSVEGRGAFSLSLDNLHKTIVPRVENCRNFACRSFLMTTYSIYPYTPKHPASVPSHKSHMFCIAI